ncbi:hypothetical protein AVEN_259471-1 [Araneus ventricosus]|uniref:Uncharacterized protein n=1 Tax=Araneus ventricosus TaxID=182803 RepID=A0A4Y2I2C1_ARAVE|nr:hypothetical protein AVEN_259471-1 [Araneus ventricosus]
MHKVQEQSWREEKSRRYEAFSETFIALRKLAAVVVCREKRKGKVSNAYRLSFVARENWVERRTKIALALFSPLSSETWLTRFLSPSDNAFGT